MIYSNGVEKRLLREGPSMEEVKEHCVTKEVKNVLPGPSQLHFIVTRELGSCIFNSCIHCPPRYNFKGNTFNTFKIMILVFMSAS